MLNILPNKKLAFQTPTTILCQNFPSFSHLKVFGCVYFSLFPSTSINKPQPWSTSCVFLGYLSNHIGYKCFELSNCKKSFLDMLFFMKIFFPFLLDMLPSLSAMDFLVQSMNIYFPYHTLPILTTNRLMHLIPTSNTLQTTTTPQSNPSVQPKLLTSPVHT